MYRNVKFRIRKQDEILDQINRAVLYLPHARKIFLADGNALVLPAGKLLNIMQLLHLNFPRLTRISCYGGPNDILNKSLDELVALKNAGLKIIYLGLESGDGEVLSEINKGATPAEMIEAGQRVMAAGIKLSLMIILGLGGKKRSVNHAQNTALAINKINPYMLSTLTLMLQKKIPLAIAAEQGKFITLSDLEAIQELEMIIRNINVSRPCIFRSNHISNLLPLAGTLPRDKAQLLSGINEMLEFLSERGESKMAVWKCNECGAVIEGRCKPGKCKTCGAPKDMLIKETVEGEKKSATKKST
jgi:hypothetical protein